MSKLKFFLIPFIILVCNCSSPKNYTEPIVESQYNDTIRVACVGNSVTFGSTIIDRQNNNYPLYLEQMLGDKYVVGNFGFPGATLLKKGHKPYWEKPCFQESLDYNPDIVIIHLGLNDTDIRNWRVHNKEFKDDYKNLIHTYQERGAKVWICRMTPIFSWHRRFYTGTRDDYHAIEQAIAEVAQEENVTIIDLYSPLSVRPDLFKDALHPSAEGAGIIAKTVHKAITGNYDGLQLAKVFSSNMVLQREKPIRIFGTANTGEAITVKLNGEKAKTLANADGQWEVTLPAMPAGGPYTLKVKASTEITLNDVMLGEVWIASGQSNMRWFLKDTDGAIEALANSNIRLYDMQYMTYDREMTQEQIARMQSGDIYEPTTWELASADHLKKFSAIAYYFADKLQQELDVPVGIICNAYGGSTTESWISREAIQYNDSLASLINDWNNSDLPMPWAVERANTNNKLSTNWFKPHPFQPTYLYNAGIKPLLKLKFRGVIWYQGESNAENIALHEDLFNMLVKDWRKTFNNGQFPFYYAQLSSIERDTWGNFRDSQRRLLTQIPNSGMVVTSDKGAPHNVHPREKKPVGERFARLALAKTYNKNIVSQGPLYKSHEIKGRVIEITFTSVKKLKTSDNQDIRDIEIAGADGKYYAANAMISGAKLLISSPKVDKAVSVRYAYSPYTTANLVNEADIPASTFSTIE